MISLETLAVLTPFIILVVAVTFGMIVRAQINRDQRREEEQSRKTS